MLRWFLLNMEFPLLPWRECGVDIKKLHRFVRHCPLSGVGPKVTERQSRVPIPMTKWHKKLTSGYRRCHRIPPLWPPLARERRGTDNGVAVASYRQVPFAKSLLTQCTCPTSDDWNTIWNKSSLFGLGLTRYPTMPTNCGQSKLLFRMIRIDNLKHGLTVLWPDKWHIF